MRLDTMDFLLCKTFAERLPARRTRTRNDGFRAARCGGGSFEIPTVDGPWTYVLTTCTEGVEGSEETSPAPLKSARCLSESALRIINQSFRTNIGGLNHQCQFVAFPCVQSKLGENQELCGRRVQTGSFLLSPENSRSLWVFSSSQATIAITPVIRNCPTLRACFIWVDWATMGSISLGLRGDTSFRLSRAAPPLFGLSRATSQIPRLCSGCRGLMPFN